MSRVAKVPVMIPNGVDFKLVGKNISVKGTMGEMSYKVHDDVQVEVADNIVSIKWDETIKKANAQAGTTRASISNLVLGVSTGFEKKLTLIGVGYRAQVKGSELTLSLGYSNPILYQVPIGIKVEATSQTELIVKGSDKQMVGQVAAEIRSFRSPEPYKGKGVRYTDEYVVRKEAKKK